MNGWRVYLWRAIDEQGQVLDIFVQAVGMRTLPSSSFTGCSTEWDNPRSAS